MLLGRATVSPWADPKSSSASSSLCVRRAGGVGWMGHIAPLWSGHTCPWPLEGSGSGRAPGDWQCSPEGSRSRIRTVSSSDGESCWEADVLVPGSRAEGSRRGELGLGRSSQPALVGWRGEMEGQCLLCDRDARCREGSSLSPRKPKLHPGCHPWALLQTIHNPRGSPAELSGRCPQRAKEDTGHSLGLKPAGRG